MISGRSNKSRPMFLPTTLTTVLGRDPSSVINVLTHYACTGRGVHWVTYFIVETFLVSYAPGSFLGRSVGRVIIYNFLIGFRLLGRHIFRYAVVVVVLQTSIKSGKLCRPLGSVDDTIALSPCAGAARDVSLIQFLCRSHQLEHHGPTIIVLLQAIIVF